MGLWNLTIWNKDFMKIGFQIVQLLNGWDIDMVQSVWKSFHSKSGCFCQGFKGSGFQVSEIWIICKPTSFQPLRQAAFQILTVTDAQNVWKLTEKVWSVQRLGWNCTKMDQHSGYGLNTNKNNYGPVWWLWPSTRGWFHKLIYTLRQTICALRLTFEKLFICAKVWCKA